MTPTATHATPALQPTTSPNPPKSALVVAGIAITNKDQHYWYGAACSKTLMASHEWNRAGKCRTKPLVHLTRKLGQIRQCMYGNGHMEYFGQDQRRKKHQYVRYQRTFHQAVDTRNWMQYRRPHGKQPGTS